jgi:hypothetical protein
MMKVKVSSILKNVYGEPLKSQRKKPRTKAEQKAGKSPEFEGMTLKDVMVNSLLGEYEGEKLTGEDKLKRYKLAMKVQDAKAEAELTTTEIAEIKELIGKSWSPLISGQAWELIEPK